MLVDFMGAEEEVCMICKSWVRERNFLSYGYDYGYDEDRKTGIYRNSISFMISILGHWIGISWQNQ